MIGLSAAPGAALADDATPVAADAADARQQYQLGTQAFAQKRFAEAAMHFEAAAAFRPHAVTLYTAALAWDNAERPERAADAYGRSLEIPGMDAKQTTNAKERLASLEKTLGTLQLKVPQGWKVQLDTLTEVSGPSRLHASPGVHTLTVRPTGLPVERREVTLEAGQTTNLEISEESLAAARKAAEPPPPPKVEPPSPPPPPPPKVEPPPPAFPQKPIGFVLAGTGGALFISGILLGTQALSAGDAYNAAPTREGFDHASGLQTWTTVAFVTGTLFAAGGVALVLLPPILKGEARAKIAVTPAGATLGGTF